MESLPQIAAVVSLIVGAGGATLLIREWLWLRYCRYIHDGAVERGQNPKPEVMIEAARKGRLGNPLKQRNLPDAPKSNKKSLRGSAIA